MKFFLIPCLLLGAAYAGTIELGSFKPIIEKVNALQTTWKADPNLPDHVTVSSVKRLLGARKSEQRLPAKEIHDIPDSAIPDEFDSRKQWPNCPTISKISDQSNCGSCWAVAGADAFSDRLCIASNGKLTAALSEADLLSCCDSCGDGCNGGYPSAAWEYFTESGLVTGGAYNSSEGCQPYELPQCEHHTSGSLTPCASLPNYDTPDCKTTCTNSAYKTSYRQDKHKTKNSYLVDGVKNIQKEILTHGPVEAAFSVYADFVTYKSGVYQQTVGEMLGGHAVRMIGWGTENGTPYWLIANSWNSHWGEAGLFKIRRGTDECGIESEITAGIPLV